MLQVLLNVVPHMVLTVQLQLHMKGDVLLHMVLLHQASHEAPHESKLGQRGSAGGTKAVSNTVCI